MRRKQLFAIILAGALAAGSAPAAVFAAESDVAAMSEEGTGDAGSEEAGSEDGSSDAETPVTDGGDAATDETPADNTTTDETPADNTTTDETPAADNTTTDETPAAEDTTTDATPTGEAQTQEQTEENKEVDPQEGESTEPVEEDTGIVIVDADRNPVKNDSGNVVYYKTLQDAIDKVADYSETNHVTTIIQISKPIVLENTVNVTGKKIEIQATDNVTITRKDDETLSFKDDMFAVTGANSGLTLSATDGATLTVSGELSETAKGAIVKVEKGGFVLGTNAVLQKSDSMSNGAAITCKDGMIALIGGKITENTGEKGAVYSNTDVWIEGNADVTGNEGANVYLDGSARIKITGALNDKSKISFTHANAKEGLGVIYADKDDENVTKDVFKNAVNSNITYEDSKTYKFKIGSDGITASLEKIQPDNGNTDQKPAFALKVIPDSWQWKDHNTFLVKMTVNEDCKYSYFYVDAGTEDEDIKAKYTAMKKNLKFIAQEKADIKGFTVTAKNVPEEASYLVVCAKQKSGNQVKLRVIRLNEGDYKKKRPAETKKDDNNNNNTRAARTHTVTDGARVEGLDGQIKFFSKRYVSFTVIGAGTEDQGLYVTGDERWIPAYWKFPGSDSAHTTWSIGGKNGKGIQPSNGASTQDFTIQIYCTKLRYNGKTWETTEDVQYFTKKFTIASYTDEEEQQWLKDNGYITDDTDGDSDGDGSGNGSGDGGTDAELTATAAASAKDAGSKSKSAVSTADESPIGTMSVLAALSLLAGGYVVVRKRKKEEI